MRDRVRGLDLAIFDFDGTLVDSAGAMAAMVDTALTSYGHRATPELMEELKPLGFEGGARHLVTRFDLPLAALDLQTLMQDAMLPAYRETVKLTPGAAELLADLRAHDVGIVVASSNRRQAVEAGLAATGVAPLVDEIVTIGELGTTKESAEIFLHCARQRDLPPHRVAVFEDAVVALRVATEAGFVVVAVRDAQHEPGYLTAQGLCQYEIDDFTEGVKPKDDDAERTA